MDKPFNKEIASVQDKEMLGLIQIGRYNYEARYSASYKGRYVLASFSGVSVLLHEIEVYPTGRLGSDILGNRVLAI